MLVFDGDSDSIQKEKEELPSYLASPTIDSTDVREKYPETVLVIEEDNVAHEAKTRIGKLLHRITRQLAKWGLEVNGCVVCQYGGAL